MKRRIIALILVMGLLAGMGLDGKMTLAAESTPAGQTKEIAKIEVVDTEIELPYKSTFTKENVVIKVTYEDATEQLVHPEKMTAVDTTKIGEQQLELSYQDQDDKLYGSYCSETGDRAEEERDNQEKSSD